MNATRHKLGLVSLGIAGVVVCAGCAAPPRKSPAAPPPAPGNTTANARAKAVPLAASSATPAKTAPKQTSLALQWSPLPKAPVKGPTFRARLPDGRVVLAVISLATSKISIYAGQPGALKRHDAPFGCMASPPALLVSGGVWMTCVDPTFDRKPYRRHFWYSADGNEWKRAGALSGMVGIADSSLGGGRLFVTGKWNGHRALLQTIQPHGAHFAVTRAKGTLPDFPATGGNVVASRDGQTVVLWTVTKQSRLVVGLSSDGGRTVHLVFQKKLDPKLRLEPFATLGQSSITFEVDAETPDGDFALHALASLPFKGGKLTITPLPPDVSDLCVAGQHMVATLKNNALAISADGGASFTPVRASDTPVLKPGDLVDCDFRGIQATNQFAPWPATSTPD